MPTFASGSGVYRIIIKYTSTVAASGVLTIANTTVATSIAGNIAITSTCTSHCYAYVDRNFTLASIAWEVFLGLSLANTADATKIIVERIILLPVEFYTASVLGNGANSFLGSCSVLSNNMSKNGVLDPNCLGGVFSLTMGLLGDPIGKLQYIVPLLCLNWGLESKVANLFLLIFAHIIIITYHIHIIIIS